jgi:hypothetical protein
MERPLQHRRATPTDLKPELLELARVKVYLNGRFPFGFLGVLNGLCAPELVVDTIAAAQHDPGERIRFREAKEAKTTNIELVILMLYERT